VNKNLSTPERDVLRGEVDQIVAWCGDALELCKRLIHADARAPRRVRNLRIELRELVRDDGAMDLYDGEAASHRADGSKIFDGVTPDMYDERDRRRSAAVELHEVPVHSRSARRTGWFRVGPLAQVNCCDFIDTPLAESARSNSRRPRGQPVHSTLYQHWARVICMLHAAEKVKELLYDDDLQGNDLVVRGRRRPEGIAWLEAPRGTLVHRYQVDENDQVTSAKLGGRYDE
jgi:NAD-reducing hydrogenase large subunit